MVNQIPRILYPILQKPVPLEGLGLIEATFHRPWTEPVRVKINPKLAVALGASGGVWAPSLTFASLFFEANRHFPWSEPVRLKPGLRPPLHPFYFAEPLGMTSPEATTESRWHYRWEEPTRVKVTFKPPLKTGEYPYFFAPPRLLPNPNVTARMSAPETNNDIAIFDINVYNPAATTVSLSGANVSIVEVAAGSGSISVKEGQ